MANNANQARGFLRRLDLLVGWFLNLKGYSSFLSECWQQNI